MGRAWLRRTSALSKLGSVRHDAAADFLTFDIKAPPGWEKK